MNLPTENCQSLSEEQTNPKNKVKSYQAHFIVDTGCGYWWPSSIFI
jgi:hypothetical protein